MAIRAPLSWSKAMRSATSLDTSGSWLSVLFSCASRTSGSPNDVSFIRCVTVSACVMAAPFRTVSEMARSIAHPFCDLEQDQAHDDAEHRARHQPTRDRAVRIVGPPTPRVVSQQPNYRHRRI